MFIYLAHEIREAIKIPFIIYIDLQMTFRSYAKLGIKSVCSSIIERNNNC